MPTAELTPELAADLERLKAALPPIFKDYKVLFALPFHDERVIDLEWHTRGNGDEDDEKRCGCGRDLPEGALETIGIGNDRAVLQIDWQALNDYERVEVRADIETLISSGVTIYHNADADIRKMRENRFDVSAAKHARLEDTMLADAVTDSEEAHDLGDLNRRHGKLPDYKHLWRVAPDEYNAGDLVGTYLIWKHGLLPRLTADPAAMFVYRTMSIPFIDIAIEGEEAGIRVNAPAAWKLLDKFGKRVEQARLLALAYTGDPTFNLGSPDQIKHWLYNVYELPVQREKSYNGELGKVVSDKDAITELRRMFGTEWDEEEEPTLEDAIANIEDGGHGLLEAKYLFGGAQQRLTHYVLPCFHVEGEGKNRKVVAPRERIYPRCKIHGQASGRVSWVGPALPQMKGEVLDIITPDIGTCWVGHDWSNIETWLLAGLAGDEPLLIAKERNYDTHVVNFCDMTGTPYPPVMTKAIHKAPCTCTGPHDKTLLQALAAACPAAWRELLNWQGGDDLRRTFSKRFVYRLHYRGKAKNAGDIPGAKALKFDVERLVEASERYLGKHPAIVQFWQGIEYQADTKRVVYTFLGRPRRLTSEFRNARNREASNHPMQGGVADIWITTVLLIKAAAPWARLVYGAYDSMFWQVPLERRIEFLAIYVPIVERMFNVAGREMSFPAEYKFKEAA